MINFRLDLRSNLLGSSHRYQTSVFKSRFLIQQATFPSLKYSTIDFSHLMLKQEIFFPIKPKYFFRKKLEPSLKTEIRPTQKKIGLVQVTNCLTKGRNEYIIEFRVATRTYTGSKFPFKRSRGHYLPFEAPRPVALNLAKS